MKDFSYVYILESLGVPDHFYIGLTDDLSARLTKHNQGSVSHTSKYRPWKVKTAIVFTNAAEQPLLRLTSNLPLVARSQKSASEKRILRPTLRN